MLLVLQATIAEPQPSQQPRPITLAGCPDKCGEISIPYPFGVKPGCFLDGFQVTCNYSFQPPRLFIESEGMNDPSQHAAALVYYTVETKDWDLAGNIWFRPVELMDISVAHAEARAYGAVRSDCSINATHHIRQLQLTTLAGPFILAANRNMLVGVGWSILVDMRTSLFSSGSTLSCVSNMRYDPGYAENGSCSSGFGCCQAFVAPTLGPVSKFGVGFNYPPYGNGMGDLSPCSYGMVVERSWYNLSAEDLYGYDFLTQKYPRGVPFVIDFAVRNRSCPTPGGPAPPDYACRSGNS
nr:unnamed protein product [Digitaria exilis]